jgi:hypothetical protein
MQAEPRQIDILLAQGPRSFQRRTQEVSVYLNVSRTFCMSVGLLELTLYVA